MTNSETSGRIVADTVLTGDTKGSVSVGDSSTLTIEGAHEGGIVVETGGTLVVAGIVKGPVTVDSLATVVLQGDLVGAVEVRVAGTLVVEEAGRLAGPVSNLGSFRNRGQRMGPVEGRDPDDHPDSTVLPPPRVGADYGYRLPPRG